MTEPIDVRHQETAPRVKQQLAFNEAVAIVDRIEWPKRLVSFEARRPGPKRIVPFRAFVIGLVYYGIQFRKEDMPVKGIAQELESLSQADKDIIGITGPATHKNVWETFNRMRRLLEARTPQDLEWADLDTGEMLSSPSDKHAPYSGLDAFIHELLRASIPLNHPAPSALALDGTAVETYYTVPYAKKAPPRDDSVHVQPEKPKKKKSSFFGNHDRQRPTACPDATYGKRTPTNSAPNEFYVGFEAHLAVDAVAKSTHEAPRLVRGFVLAPAGTSRTIAGLTLLDLVAQARFGDQAAEKANFAGGAATLYVDRGYSMHIAESWTLPLWQRGINPVFDLADFQRSVRPSPFPGTIYIDGALHTSATPAPLQSLPRPNSPQLKADEKAEIVAKYDFRSAFAFAPHSARNPANGHQRMKGPALNKTVRCPNNPESMRLSHKKPMTTCEPGVPCGCSITVTVTPNEYAREAQWPLYGTGAWVKSYSTRNAVESFNADARTNKGAWDKGYTKVRTRARTALLLAGSLVALNYHIARDWHFKKKMQNPSGAETWLFGPSPKSTRASRTLSIDQRTAG
jgi:hypothetical protein